MFKGVYLIYTNIHTLLRIKMGQSPDLNFQSIKIYYVII